MANIKIPIKVNIPDNIEINLIRSDYYDVSNTFRIVFEISLALFSGLLGYFITTDHLKATEFILIGILLTIIIASLVFWLRYQKRSIQHSISNEPNEDILADKIFHLAVNIKLEQQSKVGIGLKAAFQDIKFDWHGNNIKTDYITLMIHNINNVTFRSILNYLNESQIDYKDQNLIL